MRVLVADDSKLMRDAILNLLKGDPEIKIVGQSAGFLQTLQVASSLYPDVIVMDLHMADEKTVLPAPFKASLGNAKLIAMSLWTDDNNKVWAERLGAIALLDKARLASDLTTAIKRCQGKFRSAKA